MRDYENALEGMRTHLDKAKVVKLKNKELKQHLKVMRDNEDTLLRTVAEFKRQLYPDRSSVQVQTDSDMDEVLMLKEEHAFA